MVSKTSAQEQICDKYIKKSLTNKCFFKKGVGPARYSLNSRAGCCHGVEVSVPQSGRCHVIGCRFVEPLTDN